MAADTTQIIMRILRVRANYITDSKKVISPLSVVPHPNNRGGGPVKSWRVMQLNGTVTKEGYDQVEANSNGVVVVEQKPAVAGGWVVLPEVFRPDNED